MWAQVLGHYFRQEFSPLGLGGGLSGRRWRELCCEKLTLKPEDRGRENHELSLRWGWFNQMPGGKYGSQIGLCLEMDDINVTHCTKEGKTSLTRSDYNSLSSGPQSLRKLWLSESKKSVPSEFRLVSHDSLYWLLLIGIPFTKWTVLQTENHIHMHAFALLTFEVNTVRSHFSHTEIESLGLAGRKVPIWAKFKHHCSPLKHFA